MSRTSRLTNRDKGLRIFQANVGKNGPSHDCALALADAERFDLILLQEPWTQAKDDRCFTKTHPAYYTYSPVDNWDGSSTRPRVMTYLRRDSTLQADQLRPAPSRDLLWLHVNSTTIVNVYKASDIQETIRILQDWQVPDRCVVAGDFNSRHHSWQTGRTAGQGNDIAEWTSLRNLSLLNTPNKPTNPHGNTIDLAFSNIPFAEATVEDHLATSSDHFTISLTIPPEGESRSRLQGKTRVTTEDEVKRFTEIIEMEAAAISTRNTSKEELDQLSGALVNALQLAAKQAGHESRKRGRISPWWNEECVLAAADYRSIRRIYPLGFNKEVQLARRDFRQVVRRAKKRFRQDLLDTVTDNKDIFKIARWIKAPSPFQPPPLQIGDIVYETQIDKANALRHATLERRTSDDDIENPWTEVITKQALPFAPNVTLEEATDATINTGNTSPGSDSITVRLLRAAWPAIGELVRHLFEGCLAVGHHPQAFKEAEVVMITKPGKRDLTSPRAWRPISLLSCLGKGLERLIARRLAWTCVSHGVLNPQQAGALPKRSAVDLVASLVHDIEVALSQQKVATLVTMDIQGAFDTVMRNRLILRLRQQGWPTALVKWVASFMQDRAASIRYQDITTPSTPLQCGLPQGSPASPILFLLYTEPIYRLGEQTGRFGYADDTAILRIGRTLKETVELASADIQQLVTWGSANGISFDPDKTEVMHFTTSRDTTCYPVYHGGTEKLPGMAIRWLGIWLDRKLAFRTHIEKWAAKAGKVAGHLHSLCNTKHGPLPAAVRRAIKACVEPTLLYGTEIWYPGTEKSASRRAKESSPRILHLIERLNSVVQRGTRAILPIWKTTPLAIRHRESGIPPASLLLESRRIRFAARLKSLDPSHPLAQRSPLGGAVVREIKQAYQIRRAAYKTRLERTALLIPNVPRPILLKPRHKPATLTLRLKNKEETTAEFLKWLRIVSTETLIVYSDGSQLPDGATGYGYIVQQNNTTICEGSGRLGPAEVFDAEAVGALEGLRAAVNTPDASDSQIVVCLDNQAAASGLFGNASDSSQATFLKFQEIAAAHGSTQVRWCPGHMDIPGNERADALAKAGCTLPEPSNAKPTLAYVRRLARKHLSDAFQAWWQEHVPEQYKELDLDAIPRCPRELSIPRPALHHLLAARSRHGDFANYHERFKHDSARVTCSCGRRKAPDHLFYCRKVAPRHRMRLAPSPVVAINRAIGRDFEEFTQLAERSSFFTRICPRH